MEAAIHVLEDNPLFNAGKGAVFTHDGRNELDASIMNGRTLQAGAVAGVNTIRHPISAAIALDKNGNLAMPFNTEGMYRAAITSEGKMEIYIYKD